MRGIAKYEIEFEMTNSGMTGVQERKEGIYINAMPDSALVVELKYKKCAIKQIREERY